VFIPLAITVAIFVLLGLVIARQPQSNKSITFKVFHKVSIVLK
jgi:hypothetical protein